jgi:hypothetical protein
MNAPFASRTQVRLRADDGIVNQIAALDDTAYQRFIAASRFAEDALSATLSAQTRKPSFFVELDGMGLRIEFCRIREVFMIVSFADFHDDPEPPRPGTTTRPIANVEHLLKALGIDLPLHIASDNPSDSSGFHTKISLFGSAILDEPTSTSVNENWLILNQSIKHQPRPTFAASRQPAPELPKFRAFAIRRSAWRVSFASLVLSEEKGMITFRPPPR